METEVINKKFFERLQHFKKLPKHPSLTVIMLASFGFDYNGSKIFCSKCNYVISEFLHLTIPILLNSHFNSNTNCPNSKRQIQFINYIDSDSSNNKKSARGPLSKSECLKTFEGVDFTELDVNELAENGFIMTENASLNSLLVSIECFSCAYNTLVFKNRNFNMNYKCPYEEHKEKSPNCYFNRNKKTDDHSDSQSLETDQLRDVLNTIINADLSGKFFNSYYASEETRKNTYKNWPLNVNSINSFVKAGFYYIEEANNDLVKCFYCDGGIKNWDPIDDPFDEHARWFPRCNYIQRVKGAEFIEKIKIRYKDMNSGFDDNYNDTPHYYNKTVGDTNMKNTFRNAENTNSSTNSLQKFSQLDINSRIETTSLQKIIEQFNLDVNIIKSILKNRLEKTGNDFDSLIDVIKCYHEYENRILKSRNFLKNNYQLYVSNLPVGLKESDIENLFVTNEFHIKIKSIKTLMNNDQSLEGALICLNNQDFKWCDQIVRYFDENDVLFGKSSRRIAVRKLIDEKKDDISVSCERNSESNLEISEKRTNFQENQQLNSHDSITEKVSMSKSMSMNQQLQIEYNQLKKDKLCKECKICEKSITFLPCSHLVLCEFCIKKNKYDRCPICFKRVEATIKTYL